jgi:hypothetical protein
VKIPERQRVQFAAPLTSQDTKVHEGNPSVQNLRDALCL